MDGLTGDPEHDRPYLQEQMEKYSATKLAANVTGACQHILTELEKNEGPALTGDQAALRTDCSSLRTDRVPQA